MCVISITTCSSMVRAGLGVRTRGERARRGQEGRGPGFLTPTGLRPLFSVLWLEIFQPSSSEAPVPALMQIPWLRRVRCTTLSYIRDLSILGFRYLWGSWNQYPADTEILMDDFLRFSDVCILCTILQRRPPLCQHQEHREMWKPGHPPWFWWFFTLGLPPLWFHTSSRVFCCNP